MVNDCAVFSYGKVWGLVVVNEFCITAEKSLCGSWPILHILAEFNKIFCIKCMRITCKLNCWIANSDTVYSLLMDTSMRWTPRVCPFLSLLLLFDTTLGRTLSAGPKDVRLRKSWQYSRWRHLSILICQQKGISSWNKRFFCFTHDEFE